MFIDRRTSFFAGSCTLAACLALASASNAAVVRLVGLDGEQVPGLPPGVLFNAFGTPFIDDDGDVAVNISLQGAGVTGSNFIAHLIENGGVPTIVARTGEQAPGTPTGVVFTNFSSNWISNNSSEMAFSGSLSGPGVDLTNGEGTWFHSGGTTTLVQREGDPPPGFPPSVMVTSMINSGMNDSGTLGARLTFIGSGIDFTNNQGIWLFPSSGTPTLWMRKGDPAPGFPTGVIYALVAFPQLNNSGHFAVFTKLSGTGITSANDDSIWENTSGTMQVFVQEGDAAPGTPPGVVFGDNTVPYKITDGGVIGFQSSLAGTGVDATNDNGLWSNVSGTIELVAREGDPAPGTGAGVNFAVMSTNNAQISQSGRLAFASTLTGTGVDGTNDQGIWTDASGTLELVVRRGDPAPGTASGVTFDILVSKPGITQDGKVSFLALLSGPGIDATNNLGYWIWDDGDTDLVLRYGDTIDIDNTAGVDLRTIQSISTSFGILMNDNAESAFDLTFTDGLDAVIVAAPDPCPGDADGDNLVTIDDLNLVLGNFGDTGAPGIPGDVNLDGVVDVNDLNLVIGNFGEGC